MKYQNKEFWERSKESTDRKSLLYAQSVFRILSEGRSVIMQPDAPFAFSPEVQSQSFMFRTSGTTGKPKQRLHSLTGLEHACFRLRDFLKLNSPFLAISCLPIFHIGGWMQVMRSWTSGGSVIFMNYRDFESTKSSELFVNRYVSLVPTQLHVLLKSKIACENLRLCGGIFLGGSYCNEEIANNAREEGLPVFLCYGMTETAGMVCILNKEDFARGVNGVGKVMPGVLLKLDQSKRICIKCESLSGAENGVINTSDGWFSTSDIGDCTKDGYWRISHRIDRVINTGGEKVIPDLVEKIILSFPGVSGCLVSWRVDQKWGQRVISHICPKNVDIPELKKFLSTRLQPFEIPKEFILSDSLPDKI